MPLEIVAASWHFAYGIWLFAAKWGMVSGESGRSGFGYVCLAIGVLIHRVGGATMYTFLVTPLQPSGDRAHELR